MSRSSKRSILCIAIALVTLFSFTAIFAGSINPKHLSAASKKMYAALQKGNKVYFKTIKFEDFEGANMFNPKGPTLISSYGIDSIPALLGGINNADAKVRKAIYYELQFSDFYDEKFKNDLSKAMNAKPKWKSFRRQLIAALKVKREKDKDALVALNEAKKKYGIIK